MHFFINKSYTAKLILLLHHQAKLYLYSLNTYHHTTFKQFFNIKSLQIINKYQCKFEYEITFANQKPYVNDYNKLRDVPAH